MWWAMTSLHPWVEFSISEGRRRQHGRFVKNRFGENLSSLAIVALQGCHLGFAYGHPPDLHSHASVGPVISPESHRELGPNRQAWDFDARPLLVFWETTRACPLACKHCRASAMLRPLPGELDSPEARQFLDSLEEFGRPRPLLVMTGGDALSRGDLLQLVAHARDRGLRVAVAPTVSEALTEKTLRRFVELGVSGISISLDGEGSVHDKIRGVAGHWGATCRAIQASVASGIRVQVNTCVMRDNVLQLPSLFARVHDLGAAAWEVFFLIKVGRGTEIEDLTPAEYEACVHFLYDASCHGIVVRTVEAPFFRRVVLQREEGQPPPPSALYERLSTELAHLAGPRGECRASTFGTRDGKGIAFVAHDGTIQPGGFLPIPCGNVRWNSLSRVYVNHPLFRALRSSRDFRGRCGGCEYREICGGSRARAFARFGDALEEDPACPYVPSRDDHHNPEGPVLPRW